MTNNGNLNITVLCELAKVSRSGYYAWEKRNNEPDISNKELQDQNDFNLILEVYNRKTIKKGARTIYMILKRENHTMNLKKIRRLMKK